MKRTLYKYICACGLVSISLASCETEFSNPNAPTDEQVLSSSSGLVSLSTGIRQLYSVSGVQNIIETPSLTTRETANTSTYINGTELEDGGPFLPNDNANISSIWSTMLRIMEMCQNLKESAGEVALEENTRNTMSAYANFFKAMSIGTLAQNFEQVVVETVQDDNAEFVTSQEGYAEAIVLLEEAASLIANGIDEDYGSTVFPAIDLSNAVNAYLARYQLFAGNYEAAIAAADAVDAASISYFTYDSQNQNPIWSRSNYLDRIKPQDNFGLPTSFVYDDQDGRLDFYLVPMDTTNINGFPFDELAGFYLSATDPIPVYLPDEMPLIKAEAYVRQGASDLSAAVAALNEVRTGTADPSGIIAGIGAYDGAVTAEALLNEIYKNRRAELFLTGVSLEDSRRFNRPQPSPSGRVFTDERNVNFYPYPMTERNNNPNTPSDPAI